VVFLSAITPDKGKGIDALMTNLRMAEQVCAALARVRPAHVVYISSDAVYRETEALVDENGPADSPGLYGTMHALRERMLAHALGDATPLAVLRPTLIFGAGDTHNSYGANRFMRAAAAERRITLFGEGEEQRDHVFVDDVIRIVGLVLERRSAGVLNLVTGQSISFGDLARKVAAIAGGVAVEGKPRAAGPILHRHYDASALFRAFPEFQFTPRDEALALAWRGYVSPA
jgi:nucleoside-diphosphate-sugar epimerase